MAPADERQVYENRDPYEEHRSYRAMNRRYRQAERRRRLLRQLRMPLLAALASFLAVLGWGYWGSMSFSALPKITWRARSFNSPPKVTTLGGAPYFRSCAAARAAGYASMSRGEPGYAPHLDADGDGIACEPWFR